MRPDPLGNHRSFDIDSVSGMITLTQGLDRERQKIYEIRVEAYDLGKVFIEKSRGVRFL